MNIREKMAKGVFWVLIEKGGQQLLTLAIFTIVARLVGPEEYGLAGLCAAFISFAFIVIFGIVDPIISLRVQDDKRLSSVFWAVVFVGAVISFITYLSAVPFAHAMNDDRLIGLLEFLSLIPVLSAVAAVPDMIIHLRMDYRVFTIRSLVATSISGIVAIVMALNGAGAYSLVAQQVISQIIMNIIIWPSARWRPKLFFDRKLLGQIVSPGMVVTGVHTIEFLEQQMPRILIGYYLGPLEVGYFAFASRIFMALKEILILPVSTVLYPALAHVKDDLKDMKNIIQEVVMITGFIVFPAMAGAAIMAALFVPLLFKETWVPAVPVLQIFLLGSVLGPFLFVLKNILRVMGRLGIYIRMQFFAVLLLFVVIMLSVQYGIIPMMWGVASVSLVTFPIYVHLVSKKSGFNLWKLFSGLLVPLLASLLMALLLWAMGEDKVPFTDRISGWSELIFATTVGAAAYFMVCLILGYRQTVNLFSQLKGMLKKGEVDEVMLKKSDAEEPF